MGDSWLKYFSMLLHGCIWAQLTPTRARFFLLVSKGKKGLHGPRCLHPLLTHWSDSIKLGRSAGYLEGMKVLHALGSVAVWTREVLKVGPLAEWSKSGNAGVCAVWHPDLTDQSMHTLLRNNTSFARYTVVRTKIYMGDMATDVIILAGGDETV